MAKKYIIGKEVNGEVIVDLGPDYPIVPPPPPSQRYLVGEEIDGELVVDLSEWLRPEIPLLDTASWKYKIGNNGEDDIYSVADIACDIIFQSRTIRTIQGDELSCEALVTCVEAVVPGDLLTISSRDWPVKGLVKEAKDDNRVVQWRQVAL